LSYEGISALRRRILNQIAPSVKGQFVPANPTCLDKSMMQSQSHVIDAANELRPSLICRAGRSERSKDCEYRLRSYRSLRPYGGTNYQNRNQFRSSSYPRAFVPV